MARYSLFVLKVPLNTNQPYHGFSEYQAWWTWGKMVLTDLVLVNKALTSTSQWSIF